MNEHETPASIGATLILAYFKEREFIEKEAFAAYVSGLYTKKDTHPTLSMLRNTMRYIGDILTYSVKYKLLKYRYCEDIGQYIVAPTVTSGITNHMTREFLVYATDRCDMIISKIEGEDNKLTGRRGC